MKIVWAVIIVAIAAIHLYISTNKYCKTLKNKKVEEESKTKVE